MMTVTTAIVKRTGARGSRISAIALAIPLAAIVVLTVISPLLPLPDPEVQKLSASLLPPGSHFDGVFHMLGTDQLGRDMLARVLRGAQLSLALGALGTAIGLVIGSLLGLIAGYFGGVFDAIISRLVEAQLAIPFVLLAIAIIAANGRSIVLLVVVLGLFCWAQFARLVRGETLGLATRGFVLALRSGGVPDRKILVGHVLPNQLGTIVVYATLQWGEIMLAESALSFLGLGVVSPGVSWGSMLADGRTQLIPAPWVAAIPGIAILVTVLLINLLGDSLRTLIDPKTRRY